MEGGCLKPDPVVQAGLRQEERLRQLRSPRWVAARRARRRAAGGAGHGGEVRGPDAALRLRRLARPAVAWPTQPWPGAPVTAPYTSHDFLWLGLACCSETWIRQEDGTKACQEPSPQDRGMRQLVCHCDELELALRHQEEQQRLHQQEEQLVAS